MRCMLLLAVLLLPACEVRIEGQDFPWQMVWYKSNTSWMAQRVFYTETEYGCIKIQAQFRKQNPASICICSRNLNYKEVKR